MWVLKDGEGMVAYIKMDPLRTKRKNKYTGKVLNA